MEFTDRQKLTMLSQRIYTMTAWGAPKDKINQCIIEYNELADQVNAHSAIEWSKYEHKELLK